MCGCFCVFGLVEVDCVVYCIRFCGYDLDCGVFYEFYYFWVCVEYGVEECCVGVGVVEIVIWVVVCVCCVFVDIFYVFVGEYMCDDFILIGDCCWIVDRIELVFIYVFCEIVYEYCGCWGF